MRGFSLKWFKHYSNACESEKLNKLMDKYGLEGLARYWLLVELLARKWDGNEPKFNLHLRTLARQLRYYRLTMAKQWLDNGQRLGLYNFHCEGNACTIYFPKLLEIRDNHVKNLQVKSKKVSSREEKEKSKEKSIHRKQSKYDYAHALLIFKNTVITSEGSNAQRRFNDQVKSQKIYALLCKAIENYAIHLKNNTWKTPKQSFETFLGTERSGFYWREFINENTGETKFKNEDNYSKFLRGV